MPKRKTKSPSGAPSPQSQKTKSPKRLADDVTATPIARKRLRASQFVRKSSTKRRTSARSHRHLEEPVDVAAEDGAVVNGDVEEDINGTKSPIADRRIESALHDMRAVMSDSNEFVNGENAELLQAMKRADEAFREDITDSSSSSADDELPSIPASHLKSIDVKALRTEKSTAKVNTPKSKSGTPSNSKKSKRLSKIPKDDSASEDSDVEASFRSHRQDIEALKKDDPEFYKFLEENDAALLDVEDLDYSQDEEENQDEDKNIPDSSPSSSSDEEGDEEEEHEEHVEDANQLAESKDDDANSSQANSGSSSEESDDEEDSGDEQTARIAKDDKGEMEDRNNLAAKNASDDGDDDDDDGSDSGEDESDAPSPPTKSQSPEQVQSKKIDDDRTGYSSDEDEEEERRAEAEAAAEAGIALDSERETDDASSDSADEKGDDASDDNDNGMEIDSADESEESDGDENTDGVIVVDLKYLRDLKERLQSHRASVKACKELLKIFRAGVHILPRSDEPKEQLKISKRDTRQPAKDSEISMKDVEEAAGNEYEEEGAFRTDDVKFTSSKSFQQAMNLSIIGLQDAFDHMLGKPKGKVDGTAVLKWNPTESDRWATLQPIFLRYIYQLLSLCDTVTDAKTTRFILKRLEKVAPYTKDDNKLLKRVTRVAVRIWSSAVRHVSQETRLRAYLLLNRIAYISDNTETVLRGCCNAFVSNLSSVCNPKTLRLIHFAVACIVELFGINMGASYSTAFSYIREMAVKLRSVLVSKDEKQDVERVHNWSFINELRLWSKVLSKYGHEDELQPLIYPYVQIAIGVMRIHPTPRTYPLRLQVVSFLNDIVGETGTFIPVVPHLLSILRCGELRKLPSHSTTKILEWRGLLRVTGDVVKTKPFLTGIVNGVVMEICRFFAVIRKHVSFPELAHVAEVGLRKVAKEVALSEWKAKLMLVVHKLADTAKVIVDLRAKADFSPHGAISSRGMLAVVPGAEYIAKMPIQRLLEVEVARVAKESSARDESNLHKRQDEDADENEGDSSDHSEGVGNGGEPVAKKAKLSKQERAKTTKIGVPTLAVSLVEDENEKDQLDKLNLDSEESGSE